MQQPERLYKALQKIMQARRTIVRTAAAWQAQGIETSPLSDPLINLQEAIALLESLSEPGPGQDPAKLVEIAGVDADSPPDPVAGH